MDSFKDNPELTDWPSKPGMYWFYGYRFGKISCGFKEKPRLILCDVFEISIGLMITGSGQIMYKQEVEEAHFIPATMPELIDIT